MRLPRLPAVSKTHIVRFMQLSQYLQEQGLTLRQFASQIGVANAGVISKYLAGRVPKPPILQKIVRETGGKVSPADFYEPMNQPEAR